MVEHLLAACLGWCITDLEALVSGDELPLLDGSSLLYLRAFRQAGRRVLPGSLRPLRLRAPTDVSGPTGTITALPGPRLDATCTIDAPAVPRPQSVSTTVTRSSFCRDIAPARTFGPSRGTTEQVQRSLGLRARLRRWNGLLFPARPRMSSEPCRHKLLDLLGDLCLLGRPLLARVHAFRPGHRLNQELVRAIAQQETP
jgi:UDP-3-O-[3-hydroxymyristoyl] N-acetylglucosamine deacetylase